MEFEWDYSEYSDILHIRKNNKITRGSVELGDFNLDFGDNNEIVGVEIEHASEFFENLDIKKESLNKIEGVQFIIDKRNKSFQLIFLSLKFPNMLKKVSVPLTVAS